MEIIFKVIGVGLLVSLLAVTIFYFIARKLGVLGKLNEPYMTSHQTGTTTSTPDAKEPR